MTNDDDVPRKLNGPKVASNIPYKPNRFFWHPYIPEGETCIIAGAGGDGKGLFCCDIVARLTQGREWPLSDEYARIRNVRWFEAEDDVRKTLRPRFKAAKADLDRIAVESEEEFNKLTRKSLQSFEITRSVDAPDTAACASAWPRRSPISSVLIRMRRINLDQGKLTAECPAPAIEHHKRREFSSLALPNRLSV